jgi:hypothetical protein
MQLVFLSIKLVKFVSVFQVSLCSLCFFSHAPAESLASSPRRPLTSEEKARARAYIRRARAEERGSGSHPGAESASAVGDEPPSQVQGRSHAANEGRASGSDGADGELPNQGQDQSRAANEIEDISAEEADHTPPAPQLARRTRHPAADTNMDIPVVVVGNEALSSPPGDSPDEGTAAARARNEPMGMGDGDVKDEELAHEPDVPVLGADGSAAMATAARIGGQCSLALGEDGGSQSRVPVAVVNVAWGAEHVSDSGTGNSKYNKDEVCRRAGSPGGGGATWLVSHSLWKWASPARTGLLLAEIYVCLVVGLLVLGPCLGIFTVVWMEGGADKTFRSMPSVNKMYGPGNCGQ